MKRKWFFALFLLVIAAAWIGVITVSALTGYTLDWWTVDGGGAVSSTGGSYNLDGSIGQPDAGTSSGGTYSLAGGFWGGVENIVTHSIPLLAGWNLVSFPLHPASTVITDVLSSLGSNYDLVYAWDASGGHAGAGNWMRYAPGIPGNTLATLDETQGFWIRITSEDTLEITGTAPTTTNISLPTNASGWNLVGYPSDENRSMPEALEMHGVTSYSLVYAYHANDADTWKRYAPGVPGNDLLEVAPAWGYWIKISATSSWDVEY
jgi:hypothetical protein